MSEAKHLQTKGVRQFQQHEFEEAIQTFKAAIAAFQQDGDPLGAAENHVNLGLAHRSLDQYPEALEAMEKGLAFFREKQDRHREAQALGNMALVYAKQDNTEQASNYYREAARIFQEVGDDENYGQTILALADMHFKSGNLMQAALTFELGLEFIRTPNLRQKMAKQLLVVKNRLIGQRRVSETLNEAGVGAAEESGGKRRALRRSDKEQPE